ncbi:MAG: HU family DNA-binding protein [Dysgonamonadaceae bacterium]|jgi:nucleoid DNA-binding protein|nr:HU family DNA-binding protein [Dysgonamonadaceae bacterium]
MNEKINLPDLATLVAKQSNIDKKEAETFLKELIDVIQEALFTEDFVRIKNFGTFKRLEVSDRESVDVATGQRVLIPAHYKINFTPDSNLANAVNGPFALFETIELYDTKGLEDVAIVNEENEEDQLDFLPDEQEEPGIPDIAIVNEKNEEERLDFLPDEQEEPGISIEETPSFKKTDSEPEKIIYRPIQPLQYKRRRWRLKHFITLIYFILIVVSIYFLVYLYSFDNNPTDVIPSNGAYIHDQQALTKDSTATDSIVIDTIVAPTENMSATPSQSTESKPANVPVTKTDIVSNPAQAKQYQIQPGDRLSTIALNEYGNKIFWIYLYEENKDNIKNPNIVTEGIFITIPPASKYDINKDNPASVQKAAELQQKYSKIINN